MALSIDKFSYFSHDADMRNDIKVKALRRKFGHMGYAVWCFIIETLTDTEDLEIPYTNLDIELLAADFDVTPEQLQEVVAYCVKIELLQLDGDRLYSARHQERIQAAVERKAHKIEKAKKASEARWGKSDAQACKSDAQACKSDAQACKSDAQACKSDAKEEKKREEENREEENRDILYPYQDIVDFWNEICGLSLPKVRSLSDGRKKKIKLRLSEFGGKNKEDWLTHAKNLFERVAASDFLRGDNNAGWTATFDWLFENANNWVKVIEGNYDNDRGGKHKRSDASVIGGFVNDEWDV